MSHEEKSTRSRPGSAEQRREEGRLPRGERGTSSTTGESAGAPLAITEKDIVRFWSKVDKNGPLPDQSNPHYAGLDRCWVWTGYKFGTGYGAMGIRYRMRATHRLAWEIANGPIPKGVGYHGTVVMHLCDRPTCCNPAHLQLGGQKDNVADTVRKERQAKGDSNGARTHPECIRRGDNHGSHLHPESRAYGDKNGSRLHPERMPRGEKHYTKLRPECIVRGEKRGGVKLTAILVSKIRTIYATGGFSYELLGAMFGVHQGTIGKIIRREKWSHVPDPI